MVLHLLHDIDKLDWNLEIFFVRPSGMIQQAAAADGSAILKKIIGIILISKVS